jgi:hypothetical protein
MDPVVVVVVSVADASRPETLALVRTAEEATRPRRVEVRVLETSEPGDIPSPVVVVRWSDGARRAHLRVHVEPKGPWVERDLGFDERDAADERGRAVGLAVVAMLPDADEPRPPPSAKVVPEAARPPAPPAAAPAPAPPPRAPRFDLALRGHVAFGIGGEGGGVGGRLVGQVFVGPRLGIFGAFGARVADATYAEGRASHLVATAGVSVRVPVGRRVELGGSLGAGVARDEVRHFSADGDDPLPVSESRTLPAGYIGARASAFLSETAALELAVGADVAFGTTDVYVEGTVRGTLVPVRLFVEPGVRVRF